MERTTNSATRGYFTPDMVLEAFGAHFLDRDRCREWVLRRLHPDTPRCPACRSALSEKLAARFWSGDRVKCKSCRKYFTAVTGTFLQGTHMTFIEVVLLSVFLGVGTSTALIAHKLGSHEETIRIWRRKFRLLEELRPSGK